ncbi:hypothetical protein Scep_019005 [Stephania cephalantha]|uniref:Uncharacterized protein n=1 Tax=Stephania cephalantha TaxID=152367 RepID=A0AAP0I9W8_9MAGN
MSEIPRAKCLYDPNPVVQVLLICKKGYNFYVSKQTRELNTRTEDVVEKEI